MNKYNSPYTAAITGCSFLYYEFKRILPMLMSADAEQLLKDEVENNQILQINSRKARRTFVLEFKRRLPPFLFISGRHGKDGARKVSEQGFSMPS